MTYESKPWLNAYDPGVPAEMVIPETTLTLRFTEIAERFAHRPALHFLGVTLTYGELLSQARRFARFLQDVGCKKGDVVGINLPNLPQYLVAQVGALLAGCATSGLSPLLTPREMAYQLNDSEARVLVTLDAIFEHRLLGVADQLVHLRAVVATSILEYLPTWKQVLARVIKQLPSGRVTPLPGIRVVSFPEILSDHSDRDPGVAVQSEDLALVQYTGGTTGLAKGTCLTHRNIVSNLHVACRWAGIQPGVEVVLSGFPLFHLAGLTLGMVSLWAGGTQILIPDPRDTKHIIRELRKHRPTAMVNVPSLYMMLTREPGFSRLDYSRLKYALSGAAPFPPEAIRELERAIGRGKVMEVYGMTETSPLITANPLLNEGRIGSVGLPLPNTRVRLVDLETGTRDVPQGEEGELIVRGPQVMQGYWKKPEETDHTMRELDGETWLFTGDVATMDPQGFFYIVDRAKDMLNVGGFKVFSREVEDKLHEHPAIERCAIVGVDHPDRPGSEIVKLVVEPSAAGRDRPKADVERDILAFCKENLSPYKVPKIMTFMDELPLTPVGKVDKKKLRTT